MGVRGKGGYALSPACIQLLLDCFFLSSYSASEKKLDPMKKLLFLFLLIAYSFSLMASTVQDVFSDFLKSFLLLKTQAGRDAVWFDFIRGS